MSITEAREILEYLSETFPYLKIDKKNLSVLQKFVKKMFFGKQEMYDYIIFMLNFWGNNDGPKRHDGVIPFTWIFGNKAVERWNNKNDHWKYFNEEFCAKNGLKLIWTYPSNINLEDSHERERSKFHNTEYGYINCQDYASFSQLSVWCKKCDFKNICV